MLDPVEFGKAMGSIVSSAIAPLQKEVADLRAKLLELEQHRPKDGKSIAPDDVAPMIAEQVKAAVEAIPTAKNGKDADPELIKAMVTEAVSAIPAPKDGIDADPVDHEEIASAVISKLLASDRLDTLADLKVAEAVAKHFDANPVRDGKDVDPAVVKELIAAEVANIPKPKDGASATEDQVMDCVAKYLKANPPKDGSDGVGLAGALIDRDGSLVVTLTNGEVKHLGPVAGKDGADFTTFSLDYDGERTVTIKGEGGEITKRLDLPLDRGYWREGMSCEKSDIVTHDGNAWLALKDTKSKPCIENKDDWRLFARKGRDGRDAAKVIPDEPVKLK